MTDSCRARQPSTTTYPRKPSQASPRTVSYWNAGVAPQRSSAQKLREVTRLFDALSDIIKARSIGPWLQRPNDAFDGSTPLQVMERGENDRLWRMIWQIREGNAG